MSILQLHSYGRTDPIFQPSCQRTDDFLVPIGTDLNGELRAGMLRDSSKKLRLTRLRDDSAGGSDGRSRGPTGHDEQHSTGDAEQI